MREDTLRNVASMRFVLDERRPCEAQRHLRVDLPDARDKVRDSGTEGCGTAGVVHRHGPARLHRSIRPESEDKPRVAQRDQIADECGQSRLVEATMFGHLASPFSQAVTRRACGDVSAPRTGRSSVASIVSIELSCVAISGVLGSSSAAPAGLVVEVCVMRFSWMML
ncbi:hypothetical protein ACFSZS_31445 [Seohaeicola zhoushanensis]